MSTTLSPYVADAVPPVDDDPRRPILAGIIIVGVFLGVLGIWSAVAPVSSAVLAPAVVKVEGNRKSVQHLDGGIVKELRVKEGDRVEAGQTLIALDDTQALGAVGVLRKQHDDLRAQEARLLAERDGASTISFPEELSARRSESDVDTLLRAQENLFVSRQTALAGQV
ncbi:MAG TPA: biotin/lipoyl-binding protein, partial [Burkholderiales bacterium]|nr:biotin/lipoyl-binding protein [Burkholderiales bacterium]